MWPEPADTSVSVDEASTAGELPTSSAGVAGLINAKPIPKNPANQTPPEIVEKVLYLRSKYHLGSIRIVWYLARYHDIKT